MMRKNDYLHIRIERAIKRRLKREAKKRKMSMADLVAEFIERECE